jgi:LPS export ABC transporter protein LptC
MTVNHFFIFVALVMAGIFFGFRPVASVEPNHKEIAQLDLNTFTIYEMDEKGLIHILHGSEGLRFTDRYEVHDIAFIDNSGEVGKEMTADFGRARAETVELRGNVLIRQGDGSEVRTEKIHYDKAKRLVTSDTRFTLKQDGNRATGERLLYRLDDGHIEAKNITAFYTLPEEGETK